MSINYLSKKNTHERDKNISFKEEGHIYTINGKSDFTSVTTWIHSHFPKFDSDKIIDKMMKGKNWSSSKYFGMTKEEIKKTWDENKNKQAGNGTKLHYDIECFYNDMDVKNDSIEYEYFQNFVSKHRHLKPYRTEWMIYHEELKFAGSIDMIFENEKGELLIYDWKRCKDITKANGFNEYSTTECISDLPHTNYWHYCLQLNTYKAILEEKYGKKVSELYLVCLHPENKNKDFIKIKVIDLSDHIKRLFQLRNQQIK